MILAALLIGLQTGVTPALPVMTADEAADVVKSMLRSFDVLGPYRLQSVFVGEGPNVQSSAAVSDRDGNTYTAYFTQGTKQIYALVRGNEGDDLVKFPVHEGGEKELKDRIGRWASKITGLNHPSPLSIQSDGKVAQVTVPLVRNGYPFVPTNPPYSCQVSFTVSGGHFLRYSLLQPAPPVSDRKPVLTKEEALQKFDVYVRRSRDSRSSDSKNMGQVQCRVIPGMELGYFLPPGEKTARLVWYIPYDQARDVVYAVQTEQRSMLVDAVSGQRY